MKTPRITDEMYARIPALLEQGTTKADIAAMYGVKPGTLKVFCSQRGISLRTRRPLPPHCKLVLADEPLPLNDGVLKSLREAARSMGRGSAAQLASDLLEKIVSDDLYRAVLDEEAMPQRPVAPAPQSDPRSLAPSQQVDPTGFVRSPPLSVSDQDSSVTASVTTSAMKISA